MTKKEMLRVLMLLSRVDEALMIVSRDIDASTSDELSEVSKMLENYIIEEE